MTTPQQIHALRLRLDALMGCKSAIDEKICAELYTVTSYRLSSSVTDEIILTNEYETRVIDANALAAARDTHHALKMAKAWLGNALGELGEATPYPVADTPAALPPTADVAPPFALPHGDLLAMTNALRAEVKAVYEEIREKRFSDGDSMYRAAIIQAWVYAREASNHLGFLLAAMREYAVNSQVAASEQPAASGKETAS